MLDFVKSMKPRDHVILFYTDQEVKQIILFTFLKAGLDIGEAAIYVAGDESPNEIREAMRNFGLNFEYYENANALNIIDYSDWYIIKGDFDIDRTMLLWKKSLDEAIAKDFKGLRVVGEMACFFKQNMINELVEYENNLHRVLTIPLSAICAYNDDVVFKGIEEEHYLRLYLDLIKAHSTILFAGPEEVGAIKII